MVRLEIARTDGDDTRRALRHIRGDGYSIDRACIRQNERIHCNARRKVDILRNYRLTINNGAGFTRRWMTIRRRKVGQN